MAQSAVVTSISLKLSDFQFRLIYQYIPKHYIIVIPPFASARENILTEKAHIMCAFDELL